MTGRPPIVHAGPAGPTRPRLVGADGRPVHRHPVERWFAPASAEELALLAHVAPPVLDVGCGPGRHVLALAEQGVVAMGIDVTPNVAAVARRRGATVLERSVFDPLPGAGRWGTALLLDGNIGIGGDPVALLARVAALLRPGGRILVEVEAPGRRAAPERVRLEVDGSAGPWFHLRRVAACELAGLARRAGLGLVHAWVAGGRWFARLDAPPNRPPGGRAGP